MKHLYLIGYRGTGKTTIGRIVAHKLGLPFIDLDEEIVKFAQKSIPKIFAQEGESTFREYETKILKENSIKPQSVISCGGGVVGKEENIKIIKSTGITALLAASPDIIYERISWDKNRPALTNKDPRQEIIEMIEKRKEAYEKTQDFIVDTSEDNISKSVKEVITKYKKLSV